jgi:sarcosine oxidase gamma subunit
MATLRGVLGQSVPLSTTLTDVYTVPALKTATFKVVATNTDTSLTNFRVSVAPAGAADTLEHYIAYDVQVDAQDTGTTVTMMAQAAAVIRCYSANGAMAFTVTGLEQDA